MCHNPPFWLAGVLWGLLQGHAASDTTPSGTDHRSVAVLPFANLSSDPESEYFSDGITEDVTTHLGRLGDLKVIAQTSALKYKGRTDPPSVIGRELGVATLLQGSVRLAPDRVRVAARLVDVHTGEQIWTDEYDRDLRDVFAIQSDIAERIAAALRVRLSSEDRARLTRPPTADAQAYNLYLLGRHYFGQGTFAGWRRSIEYFERAIKTDSAFALAYVGLADAKAFLARFGLARPRDVLPDARAAALRALQLDSTVGEAHASLALVAAVYDWNWSEAENRFRRALSPNSIYARMWYSTFVLSPQQRHDEAIAQLRRALEIDPLSLQLGWTLGMAFYYAGRLDSAAAVFRRTLDLDHNYSPARAGLGFVYARGKHYDEAISEMRKAVADSAVTSDAVLGYVYALAGRRAEARATLRTLQERAQRQYVIPMDFQILYQGLGDLDSAFYWLRQAFEERTPLILWDAADKDNAIRHDPRFVSLLRDMGLRETSLTPSSPR